VTPLTNDFEAYVLDLTKRNNRTLMFLMGATVLAAVSFLVFLLATIGIDLPQSLNTLMRGDANHALSAANVMANVAVGAALRVWYNRQDKMTTLLTHAMVLDGEKETAIRVLLNKKINK